MGELDEIDFAILQMLQGEARSRSPADMAEQLSVTDQTIRNRISNMEDLGVIEGFVPVINYQKAEFPIRLQFTCTAPVDQRTELAEEVLDLSHIVRVDEMLSANENLQIMAVATDSTEINLIAGKLDDLGLTIESERLVRYQYVRPFNHFGKESNTDS